jgi:hypothetical protein
MYVLCVVLVKLRVSCCEGITREVLTFITKLLDGSFASNISCWQLPSFHKLKGVGGLNRQHQRRNEPWSENHFCRVEYLEAIMRLLVVKLLG